jgi:hypothetical protein
MAFGEKLPEDPLENYYQAHWGIEANRSWKRADSDLPKVLIEMGKLLEIQIHRGPTICFGPGCQLVYSTDASTRLFNLLTKKGQKVIKASYWDSNKKPYLLEEIADKVGGRQADFTYPHLFAVPIGRMKHCVYQTAKGSYEEEDTPDGMSEYIHKFGEKSEGTGELPMVCVDFSGRLWLAGGAYEVLRGGITG